MARYIHRPVAPDVRFSGATRKMLAGITVLVSVCSVGVVGYMLAGWTFGDGLFMVVITIFGVGYGEVRPIDTSGLRILTGFVIVMGYGAVIYTVGGFIQLVVDGRLNKAFGARRMRRELDRLEGHTIICGVGRMGTSLVRALEAADHPFVAVDANPAALEHSDRNSGLHIVGDATDERVLEEAGIERAAVLATVLSDDATNVFVTLTARAMNPDLRIIARGEERHTQTKLVNCGANEVVMPTEIGATRISQMIIQPSDEDLLEEIAVSGDDMDLVHLGLHFEELEVTESSPMANHAIGDLEIKGAHGFLIVGIRHTNGTTAMRPDPSERLSVGDHVIVLGYDHDMPAIGTRILPVTRR